MSLAEILETVATALPDYAEAIRPANGDPSLLLDALGPEDGSEVLTWLLVHEPDAAAELANGWVDEPDGIDALAGLNAEELPKAGRKVLRKVLHRLRSQGVTLLQDPRPEQKVARLPEIEDSVESAHVSALDPRGGRMVYLLESNPAGGVRLFEGVLDETRGVVDFQVYSAGRARIREFLKGMTTRSNFAVVEADPSAARALIRRAILAHPAERALPPALREWRSHFCGGDDPGLTPGASLEQGDQAISSDASALGEVEQAVRSGVLGPWPPDAKRFEEIAKLVEEQSGGQIIVSGAQEAQRLESALDLAAADLFDADYRNQTAFRFEESAYVAWKQGQEAHAGGCLAAARSFREAEVKDNPMARVLLDVMLEPFLKARREASPEAGPDSPLIGT